MTKEIKCIIVDDEPPAIRILEKYVSQMPGIACITSTTKAIEVLELVDAHKPDLLLMDIQMPGLTGLQLSTLLKDKVQIIFTTAYPDFALKSYDLEVVDYLLKPIPFERFVKAIEKAREKLSLKTASESLPNESFFVKTNGKNQFKKVNLSEICYLESLKNYVVLHTESEEIITYNTLRYYIDNLPNMQFIQIHRSFLIRLDKIEKTDTDSVWVLNKELPVGDTYKTQFFEQINKRIL